ncbi:hypothetical protein C8R47DRAFT_396267 [Mycena vitilis]|nr:hypothetical protein C8R47DRAFT_396267 [Mycena vitilis]
MSASRYLPAPFSPSPPAWPRAALVTTPRSPGRVGGRRAKAYLPPFRYACMRPFPFIYPYILPYSFTSHGALSVSRRRSFVPPSLPLLSTSCPSLHFLRLSLLPSLVPLPPYFSPSSRIVPRSSTTSRGGAGGCPFMRSSSILCSPPFAWCPSPLRASVDSGCIGQVGCLWVRGVCGSPHRCRIMASVGCPVTTPFCAFAP